MANTIKDLVVRLAIETKNTGAFNDIKNNLKEIQDITGKITKGLYRFSKGFFTAAAGIEQTTIAIKSMLGSESAAKDLINELDTFARRSPFDLKQLLAGTKQLLAFQVQQKEIIPTMRLLGNVSAATGADINRLIAAYGKIRSKGKAQMIFLNSFLRNGVPILQALADHLGVTTEEIETMVKAGQVGFKDVQAALQKLSSGYGDILGEQAESLQGQVTNIKDFIFTIQREVGTALLPALTEFVGAFRQLLENNKELITSALIAFFKGLLFLLFGVAALIEWIAELFGKLLKFYGLLKPFTGLFKLWVEWLSSIAGVLASLIPIIFAVISAYLLFKKLGPIISILVKLLASPLGIAILVIAAIIGLIMLIIRYRKVIGAFFKGIWEDLTTDPLGTLKKWLLGFLNWASSWGGILLSILIAPWATAGLLIYKFWDQIKAFFMAIPGWLFENIIMPIINGFRLLGSLIPFFPGGGKVGSNNNISPNQLNRPGTTNMNNNSNSKKVVNVKVEAGPGVDLAQKENMQKVAKQVFNEELEREQNIANYNSYLQEAY